MSVESDQDDDFADVGGSLGLDRVLGGLGVDVAGFADVFSQHGQASARSRELNAIDAESDEEKYMDDVLDGDVTIDSAEEARQREREAAMRAADEKRWERRAMQEQAAARARFDAKREDGAKAKARETMEMARIRRMWPDFEKGKKLKMTRLLYETPLMEKGWRQGGGATKRRRVMTESYTVRVQPRPISPLRAFLQSSTPLDIILPEMPLYARPIGSNFDPDWVKGAKSLRRAKMKKPPMCIKLDISSAEYTASAPDSPVINGSIFDLVNWEKDIIMCPLDIKQPNSSPDPFAARNTQLDTGDWLKDVIWDARRVSPGLLESDDEESGPTKAVTPALHTTAAATKLDPFNLSNDHLYEHARGTRFRIRQTFGAIEVFHSQPAKDLQMPWYKTSLSKSEARSWRRPALQFPVGVNLSFHKLKAKMSAGSTKKKATMADPSERFKTTKDLTMSEKGQFSLLEFSEEYPPLMSGYGMGTTIVNYYRKTDDKDETVPKLDLGQPSILNAGDAEPFLLGYVDRGRVTQVVHNNLTRAPIFKHQPETTDFLVVRQTINGQPTYYLRAINSLYTVGQTVPNTSEVPGPRARKNTDTAKMRLQIVAWLLLQKSRQKQLLLPKLIEYFPDQTELQLRQRLKSKGNEFLMFVRDPSGNKKSGFWSLNPAYSFPKERKEVIGLCTPEQAMLFEAMQVGQRHLHDAGYSKTAEGTGEKDDDDDNNLDIEQKLAVWKTTNNYRKAEAQAAWLAVHGEGDPTGRGEGFSFLRTNMKGYFLRKGETEEGRRLEQEAKAGGYPVKISNQEQNRIYEEEKRRVWDLQWAALSDPIPPKLTAEDEARSAPTPFLQDARHARQESMRAFSRANSTAATPVDSPREMSPSGLSAEGESAFTGNRYTGRVLRIKRMVGKHAQYEIVRDPGVIQAYIRAVRKRKLDRYIDMYFDDPATFVQTADTEENALRIHAFRTVKDKRVEVAARKEARKKYMHNRRQLTMDTDSESGNHGQRRCGACGQLGHTKANQNCPMYGQHFPPSPLNTTPSGMTPSGYTPGGFSTAAYTPAAYGGNTASNYFGGPSDPAEGSGGGGTSFKIRLGTGNKQ